MNYVDSVVYNGPVKIINIKKISNENNDIYFYSTRLKLMDCEKESIHPFIPYKYSDIFHLLLSSTYDYSENNIVFNDESILKLWADDSINSKSVILDTINPFGEEKEYFYAVLVYTDNNKPTSKLALSKKVNKFFFLTRTQQAQIKCKNDRDFANFCKFLNERYSIVPSEYDSMVDFCSNFINAYCGIKSKRELKDNIDAQAKWDYLLKIFN